MTVSAVHEDPGPALSFEERRDRKRAEARHAILEAAENLLIDTCGAQFSIRNLCRRCGYSAPTIYHYFGDKDGLIRALLEQRLLELLHHLDRIPRRADPRIELRELFVGFLAFSSARPSFRPLMRSVSVHASVLGGDFALPAMERIRKRLGAPIQALVDSGRSGELDTESVGQILWALLSGLMWLPVLEPECPWVPELADRAFTALLRGMRG